MFFRLSRRLVAGIATVAFALFSFAGAALAAIEVNSADASQLETVKGIGPALSGKILAERKQGNFKDWSDFENRVSGVGEKNAASFSRAGLTVSGRAKDGVAAGPDAAHGGKAPVRKASSDNAAIAKK